MAQVISEFNQEPQIMPYFTRDMIDEFFNLCHYWPLQIKKNSNLSPIMQSTIEGFKHNTTVKIAT